MKKILLSSVAVLMMSIAAQAGKDVVPAATPVAPVEDYSAWYVGVGITMGTVTLYNNSDCRYEDNTWGGMVRAGYDVNQYFGIEGRALRSFWGKGPDGGERFEHYGLYAKPMLPIGERLNVYGLLGYGHTATINSGGTGNLPEVDDWGFVWGAGVEFDLSKKSSDFIEHASYDREFDGQADQERGWGLFVDYQQPWNGKNFGKRDADLGILSVGVTYDF